MFNLKNAYSLLLKHVNEKPYVCLEYSDKFAFSLPDGSGCSHVINKKTGEYNIVDSFELANGARPIKIHKDF